MTSIEDEFDPGKNLAIADRRKIDAPAGYVSVYHETVTTALPQIDSQGLVPGSGARQLGGDPEVLRLNELFDQDCPSRLSGQGVRRVSNIFAYNSLEKGFSLGLAAQRYVRDSEAFVRQRYDALARHEPETLAAMQVKNLEEYQRKIQNPEYLRHVYPGEVLELKVDPSQVFVGDLGLYTGIVLELRSGVRQYRPGDAVPYWKAMISLSDFREWYVQQETDDGRGPYLKRPGAPAGLPGQIASPEILIPQAVPSNHIRVLP